MKNNQVIQEVEQPQSQGEKNFKDMHRAVNHKNLVPGITDQDHIFNGSTKPYDNKHHSGYKPSEDRSAYDKGLKMDNNDTDNGYETARVQEELEQVDEKINASTPTSKVIGDFVHSDNPKFKGKSTKERIKMALGAKYAMMKKEEVEIEENYDDTPEEVSMIRTELKAIVIKAQDLLDHMPSDMHIEPWVQSKVAVAKEMVSGVHDYMLYSDDAGQPSNTMQAPMPTSSTYGNFINRMGEEVEELDEISLKTKINAYSAASQPDANVNYGSKVYNQADRLRSAIVKKHGKEAGQHADSKASTDAYGRSEPGKTSSDYFKKDKLKDAKPASAMRITKSGVINKQDVESKKKEIKSRISMEEVDLNDEIEEAMGSMIGKTHKDIRHQASFGHKDIAKMDREHKQLSPKQKKIAAVAGDPNKIDADDFKALRSGKKIEEKMSPEELKKFAAIAPPKDKVTQADKIMAVKMAAKKK
jgi:hypothetical protein